jgi:hypothetical protein
MKIKQIYNKWYKALRIRNLNKSIAKTEKTKEWIKTERQLINELIKDNARRLLRINKLNKLNGSK